MTLLLLVRPAILKNEMLFCRVRSLSLDCHSAQRGSRVLGPTMDEGRDMALVPVHGSWRCRRVA